jgi:hypothetical protein
MYAEFARDARSMKLHRALVDAEVGGNLLVEFALEHVPEHLALTIGQRFERLAQRPHPVG